MEVWSEVYEMPIWLRKFTFKKIQEYIDKVNESREKPQEKPPSKPKIDRPNITPDYSVKASPKK